MSTTYNGYYAADTDMYYTTTTDTSDSNTCYGTPIERVVKDHSPQCDKKKFKSEFVDKLLHKKFFKEIGGPSSIILFARPKSDIITDLALAGYMYNTALPILDDVREHGASNPALHSYNLAIISDVLEHLPTMMLKANVIKEALATLKSPRHSYLLIIAKRGQQTEIPMDDQEYIESLALFAGAKEIVRLNCFKDTEFIYVVTKRGG